MKNLKSCIITGIIFVSVLGTLLHFAYEWSGNNVFAGLFASINESTWEHMKLIFFPMVIFSFYAKGKLNKSYPCIGSAMAFGTLFGTFLIPVLFYTYSGILGFTIDIINIATFYISVIAAFWMVYKLTQSCRVANQSKALKILIMTTAVAFVLFTFFPPSIALFENPMI